MAPWLRKAQHNMDDHAERSSATSSAGEASASAVDSSDELVAAATASAASVSVASGLLPMLSPSDTAAVRDDTADSSSVSGATRLVSDPRKGDSADGDARSSCASAFHIVPDMVNSDTERSRFSGCRGGSATMGIADRALAAPARDPTA